MRGLEHTVVMDPVLYGILKQHRPEEIDALRGNFIDHQHQYTNKKMDCIDYKMMPYGEKLVSVLPHPRFEYIPKHKHNYIEACYVCSGQVVHIIEGAEVCLRAGDFLMLNQHTSHEVLPAGEDDIAVNLIIQPRFFDDTYELAAKRNVLSDFIVDLLQKEVNCNQYLHYKTKGHLPIAYLMEVLMTSFFPNPESTQVGKNDNAADEGLNKALVFLIFRYLSKDLSELNVEAPMNYNQIVLATVTKYIEDNYQLGTLTELASIMNQSVSALSRQIKSITGNTFKELLQVKRFDRAVKLLEETNLAISDIALAVGYENSSYFYRRFREIYGISPKIYRDNVQSGQETPAPRPDAISNGEEDF